MTESRTLTRDIAWDRLVNTHGWTQDPWTGCWNWGGNTFHKFGYGQLRILGKGYDAHRLAYRVWVDWDIAGDVQVRHTCDNPPCINPKHLVPGTSQDNHDDMVSRGRALNGELNPRAKLSDEDVIDVKIVYGLGASQGAIARAYGVSQPLVSLTVNGKRRKVR